jgi:predicted amidophosphoribosyltransferase
MTGDTEPERPGDPVCLLRRVCPACGAVADEDPPTICPQCHAELTGG